MSKRIEVLVVGSGIAGLTAALAAARKNVRVGVVENGMGCLAISGGYIDALGYGEKGERLTNPYAGMEKLSADHPYSLLGAENVRAAFDFFLAVMKENGHEMKFRVDADGAPLNTLAPTIMGTLKPSFIYDALQSPELLTTAKKVLVLSFKGFRECRSRLVIEQLRRYPELANIEFQEKVLPAPFPEYGRSLSPLDLAHFADTKKGAEWLEAKLAGLGNGFDLVLTPPVLGAKAKSPLRTAAASLLGAPLAEMLTTPPGVQGLRLRDALVQALAKDGVEFFENAEAKNARVENGLCVSLELASTGRTTSREPLATVVATGGILSGGVILGEGRADEAVFGLPIPVPADVEEWSSRDVFGPHLFSRVGVATDANLRPVNEAGETLINNVFFAGRTLGGYDYAREKSGHGAAIATGWRAGSLAAEEAQRQIKDQRGAAQ